MRRVKIIVAVAAMIVAMLAASAGPAMADIFNGNGCDSWGNNCGFNGNGCDVNGNNCDFNGNGCDVNGNNCGFGFNGCGTIIAGICMPFDFGFNNINGFDNTGLSGIGQTIG